MVLHVSVTRAFIEVHRKDMLSKNVAEMVTDRVLDLLVCVAHRAACYGDR